MQDSRRRVWMAAAKERFGNFIELNAWHGQRCRAVWDEVRRSEYEQFSVVEHGSAGQTITISNAARSVLSFMTWRPTDSSRRSHTV